MLLSAKDTIFRLHNPPSFLNYPLVVSIFSDEARCCCCSCLFADSLSFLNCWIWAFNSVSITDNVSQLCSTTSPEGFLSDLLTWLDIFHFQWHSVKRVMRIAEKVGSDGRTVNCRSGCRKDDGILHQGVHQRICPSCQYADK